MFTPRINPACKYSNDLLYFNTAIICKFSVFFTYVIAFSIFNGEEPVYGNGNKAVAEELESRGR